MDQRTAARLQEEMQEEVRRIQDAVKKLNGVVAQRSKLLTQQHENEMVDKELADVKEEGRGGGDDDEEGEGDGGCAVWKLVGPVLVKVDADEARTNVRSRLKWFKEELSEPSLPRQALSPSKRERLDKQQAELEGVRKAAQEQISRIQEGVRKSQQEAVQRQLGKA